MNIASLKEQRAAKVAEMRAIHDKAAGENRDLNNDEARRFDGLKTEEKTVAEQITRTEYLAEMERHAEARAISGLHLGGDLRGYSVAKALRESMTGTLTGIEGEYHQEASKGREVRGVMIPTAELLGEKRAITTTTPVAGPGGNLVATQMDAVADRFRPMLKVEAMGARVIRDLTGNLDLPNLAASGTAYWIAEHTNTTRSDPKFNKVSMAPNTVSAEYEVSRRMLLQANTALESLLRADLGYLLAQALDKAAIQGTGGTQPLGILLSGIESVGSGPLDSDITADLIAALELDDVSGSRAFLTNPKVMKAARKERAADGYVIPLADIFHNERVEFTTQVPSNIGTGTNKNALIYGQWSELVIGYWSAVDILVNPYHADVASKGGALIHAFLDADVAVRHPEAFAYAEID